MFTQLQVRSAYSMLKSTIRIDALVSYVLAQQLSVAALVEKQTLHSSIKFYEACQKANIKPIIGLSLVTSRFDRLESFTVLAKDFKGYQCLLQCASELALEDVVTYETLLKRENHLIFILESNEFLSHSPSTDEEQRLKQFKEDFTHFYIGLKRIDQQSTQISDVMLELARRLQISVVALNDVSYLKKEDANLLQHVQLIEQGLTIEDKNETDVNRYFKSEQEMRLLFADCLDAIEAITEIISIIHLEIPLEQSLLPKFKTPQNISSVDYLKALSYKGLVKRYQGGDLSQHFKRLDYELSIIERMGFEDYFLIVWDFIKFAKQKNIAIGCGRGSAAGSLVSYVLGITNVDPIQYDLLFERFLNPERVSMPDIDIDFQDSRRDEVISYVCEKYGQQNVVQILTFGTFQSRSAWRDMARLYGVEMKLVNTVSTHISPGLSLEAGFKESEPLRQLFELYPILKRIYEMAQQLEGLPRHTSVHAAGVIISDEVLTNYTAIMRGPSDVYLSQFEAVDLEKIGLLKMDFLGLKNLTMLTEIEEMIVAKNPSFSMKHISYADKATFDLVAKGQTTGVFQLESEGMKQALKLIRPSHLEDIIAANALFRPGPMANIPLFSRRKHRQEPINYYDERLKPILYKTYGVIVYQEQIMQIASVVCRYTLGEADVLRRAVSKKKLDVLEKEREQFVSRAIENQYSFELATELFELILKFANYGFNRSHAVAYSMIAYQMAYLKTHYPAYFMTIALAHSVGSETTTALYVKEAKQLGINVLGPSVLKSHQTYTIEKNEIRFGLLPIKNIGIHLVTQLIDKRNEKMFTSYFDFVTRCYSFINQRSFECLINSGACDDFNLNRTSLHKNLTAIIEFSKFNGGLFFEQFELTLYKEEVSSKDKMQHEKDLLGFYLNSHPIKQIVEKAKENNWLLPSQIATVNAVQVICVGYVERMKEIRDKKGRLMCFCDISDESSSITVTIFSDDYLTEYKNWLGKVIVVSGRINMKKLEKNITFSKIIAIS